MNVGQVQFSVKGDGLDATLAKAKELNTILNSIDKRTVGAKSGSVARAANGAANATNAVVTATKNATKEEERRLRAKQKALKMSADAEKKYALQTRNREIKDRQRFYHDEAKREYRHRQDVKKSQEAVQRDRQNAERRYAIWKHNQDKQAAKQAEQVQKEHQKRQDAMRMDDAKREANIAAQAHREEAKAEKKAAQEEKKARKENYLASARMAFREREDRKRAERDAQRAQERAQVSPSEWRRNWQTAQVNIGAQMQTLGSAMQRISAPFTNIMRGFTMGIGYRMLYKVMDSFQGMFSRYDTMKTYGIVLEELGMDASKKFAIGTDKARTAVDNLEQAVLGLPTGLDEIVASMRVYAGATGDVEKATKLAIAANNAFIAGGMDSRQQLFTQRQLLSLAGGAELSSNQWDSLRRNAPLAIRAVAKEMGKGVQEMIDGLKNGTIAGQEFLDTFISVGTEGKLASAAQRMKVTFNALGQNIQNAMNRAGEGILKALDSVFKEMNGRTLLQNLLGTDKNGKYIGGGIRGAIDDMAKSAQAWIKANPDKIINFFKNLSNIDWKGIISSFARFGFMMGRFYVWLGKITGGGKLVSFMLWMNLFGKVIQNVGGLVKGTAGITSFLATLVKFKGLHKVATSAGKLYKSGGKIVGATKTMGTVALTWQQVASKGLSIAAIPAMAWAFKEISVGLQELAKVDMAGITPAKFGAIAAAMGELGAIAAVIGHLTASNAFGWVTTAGMAIGTAEIAGIAKTMKWVGEGMNAIAEAKIPEPGKITSIMKKMDVISKHFKSVNIFESIGKIFDAWTKSSEFKAVKNATDAFKGIADMVSLKLPSGWRKRATNRFKKVMEFVTDIESMVVLLDEKLLAQSQAAREKYGTKKGTSKAKATGNSYAYIKEQMRDFADLMQSVSDGMGYLDSALMNVKKFNKDYAKLSQLKNGDIEHFDWDILFYRVKTFAEEIYKFASPAEGDEDKTPFQMLTQAAKQLKDANFEQISGLFETLPKIIKGLETTYNKIMGSSLYEKEGLKFQAAGHQSPMTALNSRLRRLFSAIGTINENIPKVSGLKKLRAIQKSVARIPKIINEIVGVMNNSQVGEINTSKIKEVVDKINEALAQFDTLKGKNVDLNITIKGGVTDEATGDLEKAYKSVNKALKKFDALSGTKVVRVNVKAEIFGVTAAVQAIEEAIAKIRDALNRLSAAKAGASSTAWRHNDNPGGRPQKHTGGRIQYRAGGGTIFPTRGTDTVPAMLTPGEWVINRRASSIIGDNVLWKLNHMDIKGAISSLSTKFGTSSVVNNTYNRNIGGITLNNNNTAGVGLGRASRWVKGL